MIQLPPHHTVEIKFQFWKIDSWDNEKFYVFLDEETSYQESFSTSGDVLCGNGWGDQIHQISLTKPHFLQSLLIYMTTTLNDSSSNESWGIRDFKLYLYLCPSGCKTCKSTDLYEDCIPWTLLKSSFISVTQNQQSLEGWEVEGGLPQTISFANSFILGGTGICGKNCIIKTVFNLPPHDLIQIKFRSGFIDSWDHEILSIKVDNLIISEISYYYPFGGIRNYIGTSYDDYSLDDNQITIKEECDDQTQFKRCFQGKFICPKNCLDCQFGNCLQCELNFYLLDNHCQEICQNLQFINENQCNDNNLEAFDSCHQCQIVNSEGCLITENNECIFCEVGWELDFQLGICFPICGDSYIVGIEECDIDKFKLQKLNYGCTTCQFSCQDECIDCYYGKCFECILGWNVDKYKCYPICGDKKIFGPEECDDSNQIRLDGCSKCKNDCSTQCTYCVKGQCLDCLYGWNLNDNFQCEKECGDNKIALISNEECDDQNQDFKDGCYQCKTTCFDYCSVCLFGICYDCEYSFTLKDQQCIPICGDGLVTLQFEDCDYMNDIQFDGCFLCQYQCEYDCEECINGICLDKCFEEGYYEINNSCQTICGDGIIAGTEDCETNLNNDGCLNCRYTCPLNCQICIEGQCIYCDQGYELIISQNQCSTSCGNGMVSDIEECDDGNTIDNDGCSKFCSVEQNFVCKNLLYSFSLCTFELYPEFLATFLKSDLEKQYVLIHFTQPVKTQNDIFNFSNQIDFKLIKIDEDNYDANLIIDQDVQSFVMNVQYIIEIKIYQSLIDPPYLEIILPQLLYNINEAPLINLRQIVKLKPFQQNDNQEEDSTQFLKDMNRYLLNSIGGSSLILLLLGNTLLFQSLVEVIQQQSYLRFINVVFPSNLFIYFESNNLMSLQPLLEMFSFQEFSDQFIQIQYVESYEKLQFYQINADIFTNLQGQILVLIFILSFYFFATISILILSKLRGDHFQKFGIQSTKLILQVKNYCYNFKKEIEDQGLIIFGITNCWDLLFMSFLQIKSKQQQDTIFVISIILAYLITYAIIFVVATLFQRQPSCWKLKRKRLISIYFQIFTVLKKIFFMAILIIFQLDQKIQSLLLSFICSIYLLISMRFNQFDTKNDYYNFLYNEFIVFLFCFTTIFYWNSSDNYFNQDFQYKLGWLHIIMLLSVLLLNLISQLFHMFVWMKQTIQQHFQKKKNYLKKEQMQIKPITNIMDFRF